jgi:hypothetical protein
MKCAQVKYVWIKYAQVKYAQVQIDWMKYAQVVGFMFMRARTERGDEVLAEGECEDCLAAERQREPVEAVLANIHCMYNSTSAI